MSSKLFINAILEIVVLTRNRPHFLHQCLLSIQAQESNFVFELIVSDNSSDSETGNLLARRWPHISKRRFQSIPVDEHFNSAISLARSKYLMIFHDDDILLPGYLDHAISQLEVDSNLSAVACNSWLYEHDQPVSTTINNSSTDVFVDNPLLLISRYTDPWAGGAPPLSPYIYRSSVIKQHSMVVTKAGKYSDILFLANLLKAGPFLWLSRPYAYYRIHSASDNSQFVFAHKLALLRIAHREYGLPKRSFTLLNARSIYYRQFFGVSPSIESLFRFNSRSRTDIAQKFVTIMTIVRLLTSSTFRNEKIARLGILIKSSLPCLLASLLILLNQSNYLS